PPETSTLSLHDALPISARLAVGSSTEAGASATLSTVAARVCKACGAAHFRDDRNGCHACGASLGTAQMINDLYRIENVDTYPTLDRKSTRLNSSHVKIS